MKEKEILERATFQLEHAYPGCAVWRAPAFKMMRWDVFGIFDLVVATPSGQIIFIQCTTTPNLAARRKKIAAFFVEHKFVIPNSFIWAWAGTMDRFIIEKV